MSSEVSYHILLFCQRKTIVANKIPFHGRETWGGESSNKWNAYGDAGRFCSLWGMVADEMLHHGVFGHVLHKVGFLKNRRRFYNMTREVFSHTLRRIGTHWGVCAATHAATVRFSVLDGMCGEMDLQGGRVCVSSVAVWTFVWLVFVMLSLVRLNRKRNKEKQVNTLTVI